MDFSGGSTNGGGVASRRMQAERWLDIAGKLLAAWDLVGCKRFIEQTVETSSSPSPMSSSPPSRSSTRATLTHSPSSASPDTNHADHAAVSCAYRRLALLSSGRAATHPGTDVALSLIHDAYAILSDPNHRPWPPSAALVPLSCYLVLASRCDQIPEF
uniref:J domain-containing protein n=1 Tax=Oryza nivara TaxID=4536 RepID=A0A0E0FS26_ORYNI